MDRGAWQATVHGIAKSLTQLSNKHFVHLRQQTPADTSSTYDFITNRNHGYFLILQALPKSGNIIYVHYYFKIMIAIRCC